MPRKARSERRRPAIASALLQVLRRQLESADSLNQNFYANLLGGIGIAPARMVNNVNSVGTLGLIVRDARRMRR